MVLRECLDAVFCRCLTIEKSLDVWKQRLLFVHHVTSDLMGIFVVEFEDELCQRVAGAEALFKFLAYEGQLEVKIILVAGI